MRILFVTPRPPWPGRRGDQARTAGLVRHLARRHEVRIVAQRWRGFPAVDPPPGVGVPLRPVDIPGFSVYGRLLVSAAAGVLGLSDRPFQVAMFDHPRFRAAVAREVDAFQPEVAVVVLSRLGDLLPGLGRKPALQGVPVVLDLVDALAANMERRAERDPLLRWLWRWESRRLARWDARAVAASARSTVVADRDRRSILASEPELGPKLGVLPFGLEVGQDPPPREAEPGLVVLTGNLGYFPTVDGAVWFGEGIWPAIRRRVPSARWLLAGARPAAAVRSLARLPGVEVVSDPEDLGALRRRGAVSIAPLRSGSGTQIKILEALADGLPVVTTPAGADGLDGPPEGAVSVADTPEGFASAVSGLLADPERGRSQAVAGRLWLLRRHGLEAVTARFEALLRDAADGCPPAPLTPSSEG
ncbi:MAG: glycosyltransferase family 4 protein [Acidobacteriota bacterium]